MIINAVKSKNIFLVIFITITLSLSSCGITGYGVSTADYKSPVYHTVRSGDNLWTISKKYRVEPDSILLLNDIENPKSLNEGQRILVGYRYNSAEDNVVKTSMRKTKSKGDAIFVPSSKMQNSSGEINWPVNTGRVVSGFGPRFGSFHDGIDISCEEGTPIYAAHGGTVVYAGDRLSGYGNLIVLRHNTGFTSVYAHNSELHVSTGDKVSKGTYIAEVGSTGHATGPHLHFEIRVRDQEGRYVAVDPIPLLMNAPKSKLRYRINESLTPIISRLFP